MCRVLGVSTSGYYAWIGRAPSKRKLADIVLGDAIETYYRKSRENYGRPRIQVDLREKEGIFASDKRVARLMRERGLVGATRRKYVATTIRDAEATPKSDLVERNFTADAPDQLWVADITYVPTLAGFLFLAVVLDVFSRRVVGWAMAAHMRSELVVDALDMAIKRRRPTNVIHHSDHGSQYTSIAFSKRCDEAGVRPSMGSIGDCYDNAVCEAFHSTLKRELVHRRPWPTRAELQTAAFAYIEGFYNTRRRHSTLNHYSPAQYEAQHAIESQQHRDSSNPTQPIPYAQ